MEHLTLFQSVVMGVFLIGLSVLMMKLLNSKKNKVKSDWDKYTLSRISMVNYNTSNFEFQVDRLSKVTAFKPGEHVSIRAIVDGKVVQRNYTPVIVDINDGKLEFMIKVYPTGILSKYIHNLSIGDVVEISLPKGRFTYSANSYTEIGMVAGGSGITPMLQIIEAILNNPNDLTKVKLIFANRTKNDLLLFEKLEELGAQYSDRLTIHWVIEQADPSVLFNNRSFGYISEELIRSFLPRPAEKNKLLICGPLPMVSHILQESNKIGWPLPTSSITKPHEPIFVF